MMHRASWMVAAVAGSAALSGCWPAIVRHSPRVNGSVTVNGVAAVGATVFVQSTMSKDCDASSLHSTVDEKGAFAVPAGRRLEFYTPIRLGDWGFGWRMCIVHQGRYFPAFGQGGWGDPPKSVDLVCDLGTTDLSNSMTASVRPPCRVVEERDR